MRSRCELRWIRRHEVEPGGDVGEGGDACWHFLSFLKNILSRFGEVVTRFLEMMEMSWQHRASLLRFPWH